MRKVGSRMQSPTRPHAVGGLHTGARALEYVKISTRKRGEHAEVGQREVVKESSSNGGGSAGLSQSRLRFAWRSLSMRSGAPELSRGADGSALDHINKSAEPDLFTRRMQAN